MARKPASPELTPAQVKSQARRQRVAALAADPARRQVPTSGGSWIEQGGTLTREAAGLADAPAEPTGKDV